ncbi:hypothetical protein RvY_14357 [Ramazzottius varieornatus]|uniref:Uncharacterized protein n=1 Tax=Ramazzottius varieornatus TaxID=947166 RepID=A0A1D1VZG7_RAMVA|nr:hypothetical protein RvY_14357 [Ramazzottius varieornatus]
MIVVSVNDRFTMRRNHADAFISPSGSPFAKRVQSDMALQNPADRLSEQFNQMVTSSENHQHSDSDKENMGNNASFTTSNTVQPTKTSRPFRADQTIHKMLDEKKTAVRHDPFNFRRFERPSVKMQPEWHRINDVIVNSFGTSVEEICRKLEEQMYDKVAGRITGLCLQLLDKATKNSNGTERSPPLASPQEFLEMNGTIEKRYVTAFANIVSNFREQIYGVFEIPQIDMEDAEAIQRKVNEKHAQLLGKFGEAAAQNKKLAEQRAINAGLDFVLAKLDEQIAEYQTFVDFLEEDAKASATLLQTESGLADVCRALKQHKDLREFEESLRNNMDGLRSVTP